MTKAYDFVSGLSVGTVESVSPDVITVLLDTDAPQSTALNTGTPAPFPRINGYVLVPGQTGAIVGQIAWLGVERSLYPKRPGLRDFGLVDLPYPLRKMRIVPIGTLVVSRAADASTLPTHFLRRGVAAFPSVGDAVLLPTAEQLRAVVESTGTDARVPIGTAPLAFDATIAVDPDKLFGRHLAVLGNTGSGKSCTVAGLIRWSFERARAEAGRLAGKASAPNARFILLDPNGEYGKTFEDLGDSVSVLRVVPDKADGEARLLSVPAWMWNVQEWNAFSGASPKTQQPMLLQALHTLRTGQASTATPDQRICRILVQIRTALTSCAAAGHNLGSGDPSAYPKMLGFYRLIDLIGTEVDGRISDIADANLAKALATLKAEAARVSSQCGPAGAGGRRNLSAIPPAEIDKVLTALDACLKGRSSTDLATTSRSVDAPIEFLVASLPDHLDLMADLEQHSAATQFIAFLTYRIRTLLSDARIKPIIAPERGPRVVDWLATFLGEGKASSAQITVIDFSLVPSDVLHILVSAVARIVFEALQRYRRATGQELPTVLVLEEAHSFIQAGADDPNEVPTATQLCRRTFERIAREGRKFGLGLVLSSQRPSELSRTVLSQCNSWLLHRLVNDQDQEHVRKLVPDLLKDVLAELPSLPSQFAVLLGWASPIPKLVRIHDLPEKHRPHSADPNFWEVWTGAKERARDWKSIVADWTGMPEDPPASVPTAAPPARPPPPPQKKLGR